MKYWFDTEFIDNGRTIDLISIGIVSEDGRTYYAESLEADLTKACEWVKENVISKLSGPKKVRADIAREIKEFIGTDEPEFWTYFGSYDWVCLCQLYGRMIDLPTDWPMYPMDLMQIAGPRNIRSPKNTGNVHNALEDAIWTKKAYEYLMGAI